MIDLETNAASAVLRIATACADAGDCPGAADSYAEAVRLLRSGDSADFFTALDGLTELRHLERFDEAEPLANELVDFARRTGDDREVRLASAFAQRGHVLLAASRMQEAVTDFDLALVIGQPLLNGDPAEAPFALLARADLARGDALRAMDCIDEAADAAFQAIRKFRLAARFGDRNDVLFEYARALRNRASAVDSLGRCAEAIGALDEAVSLLWGIENPSFRIELAQLLTFRANVLMHVGRNAEAELAASLSCDVFEEDAGNNPYWTAGDFAGALAAVAKARAAQGQCEEAAEAWRRAVELSGEAMAAGEGDARSDLEIRAGLATELVHVGDLPEAIEIFDAVLPALDCGEEEEGRKMHAFRLRTFAHALDQTGEETRAAALRDRAALLAGEPAAGHEAAVVH